MDAGRAVTPSPLIGVMHPRRIVLGGQTSVVGSRRFVGAPIAGSELLLEANRFPWRGFEVVARTITAPDGSFAFRGLEPSRNTRYRVVDAAVPGVSSVPVEALVGAPTARETSPRPRGRLAITLLVRHPEDLDWGDVPARWYVSAAPGLPSELVATTRTFELAPAVTELSATLPIPADRFTYRVCFAAPEARAMAQAVTGTAGCGPGEIAYEGHAVGRLPVYPPTSSIAAASSFLATRIGQTAFAVVDNHGRLRGAHVHETFVSASVVKAMLLVAYLRQLAREHRSVTLADEALLYPMIHVSDNGAATAVASIVGDGGLDAVSRLARMHDFALGGDWAHTQISAADQARLFFSLDQLLPAQSRGYARGLLSGIDPSQSWGIPSVARPAWDVFFKGGWLPKSYGLVSQVARLEAPGRTFAAAVLTEGNPSMAYGEETIAGVGQRLVG